MNTKSLSTTVALTAAALFLGACEKDRGATNDPGSEAAAKKIKCFGVNGCSGQSACDVPDGRVAPGSKGHACAGQNECAKKGWILLTAAECSDQGGEPV